MTGPPGGGPLLVSSGRLQKVASLRAQGALGAFGPLKKVASLRAQGAFGPIKKVALLRAQGAFGPLKKSLRSGIHARNPPKWSANLLFHARKSPKWAASPPILGCSGHEIKGVADHFGGFQAWIPERSDFFKVPKGPKGPLGPERSDLGKPRKVDSPKKKKVEKPQDGRQKSGPNIGNP